MELKTEIRSALTRHTGQESSMEVAAGRRIKIETSPGGSDLLDFLVPAGGCKLTIHVQIDENGT